MLTADVWATKPRKPFVIVEVDMKHRGVVCEGNLHSRSHGMRVEDASETLVIGVPVVRQ